MSKSSLGFNSWVNQGSEYSKNYPGFCSPAVLTLSLSSSHRYIHPKLNKSYFLCQVVLLNICQYFCWVVLMVGNYEIVVMFDNLTTGVLMVGNFVR